MKVTAAMVVSLDGKTTKWDNSNIYEWTSKEDWLYFSSLIKNHKVIIMGRKTYEAAKSIIKLSPTTLRIIMTKNPEKYKNDAVPAQLEFTNKSVKGMVKNLTKRGYEKALLVGGEQVSTQFFKESLVNELWLTIEPYIFGYGNSLLSNEKLNVSLELKTLKKLNNKGALLLKYKVI